MSVKNGVALVTGAAQGIGRSIALRLANDGYDVALNGLPAKCNELRAVALDIEKTGQRALLVPGDVSVDEEVKKMVEDTSKELGSLDVMVANAGVIQYSTLITTELDDWERIIAVNLRGTFLCYKYAAQQMIKQERGGRIIGASSLAGTSASPFMPSYVSSKFAIRGLTQAAALELAQHNITVNCYAPGPIETTMPSLSTEIRNVFARTEPKLVEMVSSRLKPLFPRIGQPEEVAALVSYLASKDAGFVTGQCLSINGGIHLS